MELSSAIRAACPYDDAKIKEIFRCIELHEDVFYPAFKHVVREARKKHRSFVTSYADWSFMLADEALLTKPKHLSLLCHIQRMLQHIQAE
ncbi:hypothetical protein [Piscirickettsia litoralis]|uniref:Uncharacterized protein n=1 Tax=Piscirickettsia litoralis TaxID=1891921 RepID=A0ABX3A1A8_9GAMM|nr:hypothetical protein [Piscirickettsia litoralis]ODN42228.1 hypothetical protein BGC07_03850 [Piscirickettsia litoralis]